MGQGYSGIDGVRASEMGDDSTPQREPVEIPAAVLAAMISHAQAGAPEEICGIVRGDGERWRALEAIPAHNVAEERIQNYTVDPKTLLMQFAFEDAGERMMAIYHSHPVSPAFPSATDAWNANYPDTVYVIVSLKEPGKPVARGWALETEAVAVEWEEVIGGLPFFEARPGIFACFQGVSAEVPASIADLVAPPYYLVYAVDETGTRQDARLVSVREHPLVVV